MEKNLGLQSKEILSEAKKYLVAGVNSPVRYFGYVKRDPLLLKKGRKQKVFDYDNQPYIDYVLSWGALLLGHNHPGINKALRIQLTKGLSFGMTSYPEIEFAKLVREAIPYLEKIRFVNSGTESVMSAIRAARAYTGKDKIVKFRHSYHGHADYLLTDGGSGLATFNIASSLGVPENFLKDTIVVENKSRDEIKEVFRKYKSEIAALIIEPVGANFGVEAPDREYIEYLRVLTKKYKSLLIFDEVVSGFRFRYGSISKNLGIKPDLICLGKIIGAGLPVGAYGGSNKIMKKIAPTGGVYQASTFGGNPLVMRAGASVLKELKSQKGNYKRINKLTEKLAKKINILAKKYKADIHVLSYGSIFSLKSKLKSNFINFYNKVLNKGILFAPSECESNFLSFAHTGRDIQKTLEVIEDIFKANKRGL